jgi:4-aminobutyrate aminotransferase-like enzyme
MILLEFVSMSAAAITTAPTALKRNRLTKPDMITVEEAKALEPARIVDLFAAHLNPGQLHFMKLLGFHKIIIDRAEGMHYFTRDGQKILDFFGGFGSLAFGHNHPRIVEARKKFQTENRHEIAMAFVSRTTWRKRRRVTSTWCSWDRPGPKRWRRP